MPKGIRLLGESLIPGIEQGKYKMGLEHLTVPEGKEVLKE